MKQYSLLYAMTWLLLKLNFKLQIGTICWQVIKIEAPNDKPHTVFFVVSTSDKRVDKILEFLIKLKLTTKQTHHHILLGKYMYREPWQTY